MTEQLQILPDSPLAAQPVTITAWKARNGQLYWDEQTARYAGSTHSLCKRCQCVTSKDWTLCLGCREKLEIERFEAMPRADWDGESMIYSQVLDKYFRDMNEVEEALEDLDEPITKADARLVICRPNRARQIDPDDFFVDDLPEDGEVPDELRKAFEALNAVIAKQPPLSWSPGPFALRLENEAADAAA